MEKQSVAAFGESVVDFDRMELRRAGRAIPVTYLECRLLKFFVEHPEHAFSREDLLAAVWPQRKRASCRTVDNSISHLRRKTEPDPKRPVYFQTVHGFGYKFIPSGTLLQRSADTPELSTTIH